MKTVTFTIELPSKSIGKNFTQSLLDEIDQDAKEMKITHAINTKTSIIHRDYLIDVINRLNKELKPLNIQFGNLKESTESNLYTTYLSEINLGQNIFAITCKCESTKHEITKYTTYSGTPVIHIGTRPNIGFIKPFGFKHINPNQILDRMKTHIKYHITNRI